MNHKRLTDKAFWENRSAHQHKNEIQFFAHHIIKKYLQKDTKVSFLEFGCYPGRFLIYFAKMWHYQINGIDFDKRIYEIKDKLELLQIKKAKLIYGDIFKYKTNKLYDVVFSAGLVEHFENPEKIFDIHLKFLKSKGKLIITLPNMLYFQKFLRMITHSQKEFDAHNLSCMRPRIWENIALKNNMRVLYAGYCETFRFWLPPENNSFLGKCILNGIRLITIILRLLHLHQIPNKYFSPHIVIVAEKN